MASSKGRDSPTKKTEIKFTQKVNIVRPSKAKQSQLVPVAFSLKSFWPPDMQLKDVTASGNPDNQSTGTSVGANPELQLNSTQFLKAT